jgi:hypothetical protein
MGLVSFTQLSPLSPGFTSSGIFYTCTLFLSVCILLVMRTLQYVVRCELGDFNGKD